MDFFTVGVREIERGPHKGQFEIFPDFIVGRSKDLMVRGKAFYAIWDEEAGLWSTDEYDVQRLVDKELAEYAEKAKADGQEVKVKYMKSFGSNGWSTFRKFVQNISDNSHDLDGTLTFANTEVKKSDFVSRRLPYPLAPGDISAWNEIVGTLYEPEERAKIEWAIGAIVSGDSKKIQKFLVFYGPGGTGKSTIMNIVISMFQGYTTTFVAKDLVSNNNSFATEVFAKNPLVAIQQDGDLSDMADNSRFNSIISHEDISMNAKFKPIYTSRVNAFLFMGTNKPVKISDAKSGIIRRLIDVHPTGDRLPPTRYHALMSQIDFELGAIAHHCLETYRSMGKNYYESYQPLEMMFQTDVFFNYIEAHYDIFKSQDGTSLRQAYTMYKEWCQDAVVPRVLPQYKFREELRNYFDHFHDRITIDGEQMRSFYQGFNAEKFKVPTIADPSVFSLSLDETTSIFDLEFAEQPAQMARIGPDGSEIPSQRWINVKTTLADVDTNQVHYVKVPDQHIVIDFDLKDEKGEKSLEKNLAEASLWPPTYAELSKGGNGVHLHYTYEGDVTELASVYRDGIEIKTLLGDASLRRRLSKCNNVPVATINTGLPFREKKSVLEDRVIKSERGLRNLIERNLRKEINPGTKVSIDFIKKILDDVYDSGMPYNVEDMRPRVIAFANKSTNQPLQSLKTVLQMKWKSEEDIPSVDNINGDERLVVFDVEVYPNLFVVCWKYQGAPKESIVRMFNPGPKEMENLMKMRLVGFFNRQYDNHIIYARFLGYNNEQLFKLSQKLIEGSVGAKFGEAYGISYADIYEFASIKMSLKKWQIELGIHHMELDIPWDEPVPTKLWDTVGDYCANDVESTDAVLKDREADLVARKILAELSGLSVNDTTQKHTAKIIFGNDRNAQSKFVYTDLSQDFPGYQFDPYKPQKERSTYRGEIVGEGGYVYAEPGMYEDVTLLDVASMHPTSLIELNAFGPYTPRFADLLNARLAIKHGDYESARKMLDGRLAPYLENEEQAEQLAWALKIIINIVYGMTSASFDNPFRDPRNVDNIVAKRGALFMIDLKNFVQEQGYTVAHIKTDSIKIPNATTEIIDQVMRFGEKYGYSFEHEATYDRFCLVNDAVYIARYGWAEKARKIGKWEAVGAQFQHPYVFKTMFSKEKLDWNDYCEPRSVQKGTMYLDFESVQRPMFKATGKMQFIGRTGLFVPVTPESGGGILYRVADDKNYAVAGTKGFFWLEAVDAAQRKRDIDIDMAYFENLATKAFKAIEKYGSYDEFVK